MDMEDEDLQRKAISEPIQRMDMEDEEEPTQGKFATDGGQSQGPTESTRVENLTGIPDQLEARLENLSGYDLSGVRVNYNSAKPAQLNAHAYTHSIFM